MTTTELVDDGTGAVRALRGHQVEVDRRRPTGLRPRCQGSEFELPCDLVLLAMGFLGAERHGVVAELGLELDTAGHGGRDATGPPTSKGSSSAAT